MKGLPSYAHGRVCILGDSVSKASLHTTGCLTVVKAHAMTTHIGQGGGQGIEVGTIIVAV